MPKRRRGLGPGGRVRRPSKATLASRRKETVFLRAVHRVNGVVYGPGPVDVLPQLASMLREQERRVTEYEEVFSSNRAFIIGAANRNGTVRPYRVPFDTFDTSWTQEAAPVPLGSLPTGA